MTTLTSSTTKTHWWQATKRLQWRLTLAYALFTALTALVLGLIGVALWWYFTFWVSLPNDAALALQRTTRFFAPYLQSDIDGLSVQLENMTLGLRAETFGVADPKPPPINDQAPKDDSRLSPPLRLDQALSIAIFDADGNLLTGYPTGDVEQVDALSAKALSSLNAALHGETDPATLAYRNDTGNITAAAPIFSDGGIVIGAIIVETVPAIQERDFLALALRQMILPAVWGVLLIGGVAGVLFGYFIARHFTRRLDALAEAADAWSDGNFEVLVTDASGDELGVLAERLNQMALQLQTLLQTRQELASVEERNRLARDLHDAVKQQVFATAMQIGAALTFFDGNPPASKQSLAEADRLVHQTQQELNALIQELRPVALQGQGLTAALRQYVADWSRQNNIAVELRVQGEQTAPLALEQTMFRIAQEALANIARHSGAGSVEIYLAWEDHDVVLSVTDDGGGFDPVVADGKGVGLRSMRERIEDIGGHLHLESKPGHGAQVVARCPAK